MQKLSQNILQTPYRIYKSNQGHLTKGSHPQYMKENKFHNSCNTFSSPDCLLCNNQSQASYQHIFSQCPLALTLNLKLQSHLLTLINANLKQHKYPYACCLPGLPFTTHHMLITKMIKHFHLTQFPKEWGTEVPSLWH